MRNAVRQGIQITTKTSTQYLHISLTAVATVSTVPRQYPVFCCYIVSLPLATENKTARFKSQTNYMDKLTYLHNNYVFIYLPPKSEMMGAKNTKIPLENCHRIYKLLILSKL